ncbi:ATP-dependent OLD family endonuclease [Stenotrophomonas ginsengisoli]|uniref:ATP-dependent OLD family endonuclease n=1 Tax=Stenotrophomonas ginsengisoli TaxID=336566 RepID=A0A0R0DAR1_9GAMM|nr:ATP-binding protein [Stenotrophomonas ginsengisoli]KRG78806.1 ATP-dependent OLD family endonuclease [Stenotrophomonas ginsengisoli]
MRLEAVSIKNFRCYGEEVRVELGDLTTFIGRNDIGKSTVLEALEIFFNDDLVSMEQGDAHVHNVGKDVSITCEFSRLPPTLTLDAGAETTLADEYLLANDGRLKIRKTFDCKSKKPSADVLVIANHPTAADCANLLELKENDLQKRVRALGLDVALKGNPGMRRAIWAAAADLQLQEVAIPVGKSKEDVKRIWEQIEPHLPMFALFQSDRSSRDSDDEVQSPMKAAVAAAIAEVQDDIARIQAKVREKAEEIAQNTHAALATIDPNLASKLTPEFSPPTPAKWQGLFSLGLNTDDGIPLNKRGSGVRRLVLVSFFKAEAERRLRTSIKRSIIYAIEEPETAQHPNNQRILIDSFKMLSEDPGCQVILTTHSPGFASSLPQDSIRYVSRHPESGKPQIQSGMDVFGQVAEALGVTPDSRVQVLVCVEGPTDVLSLKALSNALHQDDATLPNLASDDRLAFIVLGGGTLEHWVNQNYLRALNKREVHIYDGDVAKYAQSVDLVNARIDGSWAVRTTKHEIESYLHTDAISLAFGVEVDIFDHPVNGKATPKLFAEAYSAHVGHGAPLGDNKAKGKLAQFAFPMMTAAMLDERDPDGEIRGWMRRLGEMLA